MNADQRVRRYYPGVQDRADSDADVARFEERFACNGFGLWAVQRLVEGDFIGYTGLNPMPRGVPGAGNEPSIAVMRRISMSEYARVEHPGLPAGHPLRPHVVYRITRWCIIAVSITHHDASVVG